MHSIETVYVPTYVASSLLCKQITLLVCEVVLPHMTGFVKPSMFALVCISGYPILKYSIRENTPHPARY